MSAGLLPLFPLEVVLFPSMPLPLHIFEPRYRRMIHQCLEGHQPFGVVYSGEGTLAGVGCAAEIVDVLQRYPDGRLDILTEGRRRFRLLETNDELDYLRGSVEWLEDEGGAPEAGRARVLDLYRRTYWAHAQGVPPSLVAAARHMSYLVARSQLMGLADRQRLLEIPREEDRLEALAEALEELEPVVRRLSGNGHGLPS